MRLISCPPSFSFSSKKKTRINNTSTSNSPNSVLSPKPNPIPPKFSRQQLEFILRRLPPNPPSEAEVEAMLAEADRRGDGPFTLEEIAALGIDSSGPGSPDLRETFGVFDGDGDGKISAEELFGVFSALGDDAGTLENCRRMIGVVDTDGDGFVCFDEFVRMMRGQR